MAHLETKFEIKSWDEETIRDLPDGQRLRRATVALSAASDPFEAEATLVMLLHYGANGTTSYVSLMQVTGRLDGRSGSFVLRGAGSHDGTYARSEDTIVAGSGTGELAGIAGGASSVSTHADHPHMPITLDYTLDPPA